MPLMKGVLEAVIESLKSEDNRIIFYKGEVKSSIYVEGYKSFQVYKLSISVSDWNHKTFEHLDKEHIKDEFRKDIIAEFVGLIKREFDTSLFIVTNKVSVGNLYDEKIVTIFVAGDLKGKQSND